MHLRLERHESPLSPLLVVTDAEGAVRALEFGDHEPRMHRLLGGHYGKYILEDGGAPPSVIRALDAYFEGDLDALDEVQTATGGTAFQRDVWQALRSIPAGTTQSYGQLAATLGRAGASRAVGAANGSNPIAIIVPCHRVIGSNGTLTGYGGGLPRKRWLLDFERRHSGEELHFSVAAASAAEMRPSPSVSNLRKAALGPMNSCKLTSPS